MRRSAVFVMDGDGVKVEVAVFQIQSPLSSHRAMVELGSRGIEKTSRMLEMYEIEGMIA